MNNKKEMTKYRIAYAAVVGVISILVVVVLLFLNKTNPKDPGLNPEPVPTNAVACTMDARICPDGSAVGRVGPKCEFEACPVIPEGVTYVLKGQTIPESTDLQSNDVIRASATNDAQLRTLFGKFLGKLEAPNCYTTVTGENCVSDSDLGGLTVDWKKSFVVGTSLGTRGTGGYDVAITGFEDVGTMVYVFVQEKTPGKGCFVTEMLTNPFVVAKIDISAEIAAKKTVVYKVSTVAGPECQE